MQYEDDFEKMEKKEKTYLEKESVLGVNHYFQESPLNRVKIILGSVSYAGGKSRVPIEKSAKASLDWKCKCTQVSLSGLRIKSVTHRCKARVDMLR